MSDAKIQNYREVRSEHRWHVSMSAASARKLEGKRVLETDADSQISHNMVLAIVREGPDTEAD